MYYARVMRFRVLGPLEVEADDGPVVLGGPKERRLLAQLLVRPNQVVPVEALVQGLWGEHPPKSAPKTLQAHVVRLRHALEPGRARGAAGQVLVTRGPGYLLRVGPEALDAARFEELAAQARRALADDAADAAASTVREALGLWRGRAFEEFTDTEFGAAEADRLGELRLVALEDRIEADLRLGRHRELVAELEGLVRDQPLRERLWAQLMLALYRSGRQADALLGYQRARSVLVEELGIDPGAELRALQAAILAQDPGLDLPAAADEAAARELPQTLGIVGPAFVGRAAELAWLRAAWAQTARGRGGMVFLSGGQGMGKTRLAAEFAREVHDQGGWVLYGRCEPAPPDPLQPFAQALAGVGASPHDVLRFDPERSMATFGQGLADLLAGRCDGATLLVLDDLHLAQPSVLQALAGLAGAGAARRLLVFGAYQDQPTPSGLAALAERLDPDGSGHRRLGPLDLDEVARVVAIYGGEQTSRAAAGAFLQRTGGVPLLVHRAANQWAQAQAADQVDQVAGQTALSRSHLRVVQARLAEGVVDLHGLREHAQQMAGLATGEEPPGGATDDRPAAAVCPYKGLARFEPSDAEFFVGRERLTAVLVARLVGAALVGVIGPSGSGKSSLIRAGLLPALRDGALPGSDRWRQLIIRPGEHPLRELARALGVQDEHPGMLLAAAERGARADGHLLVVVDQFEEVFTACPDQREQRSFLNELLAAITAEQRATVVLGIRADYYGRCAEHPGLAEQLGASQVLVGPMDAEEVRRAIELPAHRAGLRVEPQLTKAMVADVAGEPGGLPLLSTALLECWERRQGRTLTLAGYRERGGVHGAVARLAERAYRTLDPGQQAAARRLLLRLAGPGEGQAVTRRRVALAELEPARDQPTARALEVLTARRLLTVSDATVEVAHEALLREWPRLRGWLEEDVQGRALHRHLTQAAREWEGAGRDPAELYRGARLAGALDWARDHHADLNDLECAFLDAGRAAAEREVADARQRAEREARTSRRLRGLLAGLAAVLALALVAGGFAIALRGRAEHQRLLAQHQTLVAESRRLGAEALLQGDLDRSLLLAVEAVRLDDSVDTRGALLTSLLRSPQAIWMTRGGGGGRRRLEDLTLSPDGRTLAAVDSDGLLYLWDAQTGRHLAGRLGEARWDYGSLNVVAFSPDGRLLATGGVADFGGILLWDVASRRVVAHLPLAASEGDITDAAFSPDGHILAAGTLTGSLVFWKLGKGGRTRWVVHPYHPPVPALEQGRRVTLAFAAGGATLYTSAHDGKTILWDVARRHPVRELPLGGALAVSPDATTLALGQLDGPIILADARTGRRRKVLTGHTAEVFRLTFSRDGSTLASVSDDSKAIVWDVASGQPLQTLRGHTGWVHGVAFSPDGRTLYTSSLDDSLIAWDLTGTRGLARQLSRTAGQVGGVAFSSHHPNLLALLRSDGPAQLWDLHKGAPIANFPSIRNAALPSAVAFSPDDRLLAADNSADGTVGLFDVATHAQVGRLRPAYHPIDLTQPVPGDVNAMAFSPNGKLLATAENDGWATLWDLAKQAPVGPPQQPEPGVPVDSVAFSPDGTTLAWGMDGGTVTLTRVSDGKVLQTLPIIDGSGVLALAFSPDGRTLATGTGSGHEGLWDPNAGTPRGEPWLTSAGPVLTTSLSPDGQMLATSGVGSAELWDASSGKHIGALVTGRSDKGSAAAFDPSGHTLVTASGDGTVLLWDVDPVSWRKRACALADRRLTQQEWQDFLPGRPYRPFCAMP
jgi:WD40 repeat protein/DNA-binding SARP family transcriptional activator